MDEILTVTLKLDDASAELVAEALLDAIDQLRSYADSLPISDESLFNKAVLDAEKLESFRLYFKTQVRIAQRERSEVR